MSGKIEPGAPNYPATLQYPAGMLYHLAPQELVGSSLLPLSQLRSERRQLYERHARKYEGRTNLLDDQVPGLDCRWQDVVFLTAVKPGTIRRLHEAAGFELPELRWIQIDSTELAVSKIVIYWYRHSQRELKYVAENWQGFRVELLAELQQIPDATHQHYADAAKTRTRPFAFFRTPHILHKGALDVTDCVIVQG